MQRRIPWLLLGLMATWGCAHSAAPEATPPPPAPSPAPAAAPGAVSRLVEAAPERGFNYPYLLRLPASGGGTRPPILLVEPNNTGKVSDDFAVHLAAARQTAERAIGGYLSRTLGVPLLMPVFPRPESEWRIYTHALDRDAMTLREGPMRRLDLQLLAMIDDARRTLAAEGWPTREQVLLTGFSASGTFGNRFTLLHPDRVRAVASGGVNGILMLPEAAIGATALPYPLGTSDFEAIAGAPFRRAEWRRVPQFIYMGADDRNDAVEFDDGYSEEERAIVYGHLGRAMQPDRWELCQARYREAGARVTFRTYAGVGHGTDGKINAEIAAFFAGILASAEAAPAD